MNELSREARELVDLASAHDGPTAADRARVRRAVTASLAAGAVTLGTGQAAAGASTAAGLTLTKLAGWVALGAAVGVAGAVPLLQPEAPKAPTLQAKTAAAAERAARAPVITPRREAPAEPEIVPAPPAAPTAAKAVPSAAARSRDSLSEESALLTRAQRLLAAGDSAAAERALAEHSQRFPNGLLAEERRAVWVVSVCQRGDLEDGRRRAQAFLAAHPSSPLAQRVRTACKL